jgi:hypothetical protein
MIVSNEREQRQQWLNSLKVGDEVAVDQGKFSRKYAILTIEKITPTRRFRLSGVSEVFDNTGREMGAGAWGSDHMEPITDAIRESAARYAALEHIKKINFSALSTQQLLDVLKVIQHNE